MKFYAQRTGNKCELLNQSNTAIYVVYFIILFNLITEHNYHQWVGHSNQSCPCFFFLQYHWYTFNMQSTHRAVSLFLSTSHSLWRQQCASILGHKHEVQIPSHGHWPGGCHDCLIWIICSVWNGSEYSPATQQLQLNRCGQILWVIPLWVGNLLLIHFRFFRFSECEISEYCSHLSSTLEPFIELCDSCKY